MPEADPSGVAEIVAVPLVPFLKWVPGGSFPVLLIAGTGDPVVVTVNLKAEPNATLSSGLLVNVTPLPGVTQVGALIPESPTVVCATTVITMHVALVRPVIVQVVAPVVLHSSLPGIAIAVYPVSMPVSRLAGAVQDTVAAAAPGIAVTLAGGSGPVRTVSALPELTVSLPSCPSWSSPPQ